MDEVVVLSEGSGRFLLAPGIDTRVISSDEIAALQVNAISELLETVSSLTLTERGTPGSQADLSIRGASPEGVLLLINGIRAQDPQTGHFLMDIPLDIDTVERVEILAGGGSTLYGSDASGGIVNIVTRTDGSQGGGLSFGSFGGRRASGTLSAGEGKGAFTAGARWGRSDGDAEGTDLEYSGADVSGRWNDEHWNVRWNAGVAEKRFGAQGFYGDYPSFEEVMTLQAGVNALRTIDEFSVVRLRLGGRGHRDEFTLIRSNPGYYRNTHFNRGITVGGEYSRVLRGHGSLVLGAEAERIGITSGKLGNRSDGSAALYGEYSGKFQRNEYSLSLRLDRGYGNERVISPGVGVQIPLSGPYRLRMRLDRSFRVPTYTERFYNDPANRGNPDLHAEHSTSAEAGLNRDTARSSAGASLFATRASRVIDWVRDPGETAWSAVNHGRLLTVGGELSCAVRFTGGWRVRGSATLLRQTVRGRRGTESKYVLNPAEETLAAVFSGPLASGMAGSLAVRYERMRSGGSRTPVDVRLMRRFEAFSLRGSLRNLGNERYEEIPGLRAPGRSYQLEMEFAR